ncbi:hypothetical protein GF412_05075 [Candidatus Micrarchaeota archaeon]|nr:hypothetical protein [Candidatus Micrarchaeota archaeon]MBD3418326.1 hypothetical protein [Candidatus Micrarchaeota archaeon]
MEEKKSGLDKAIAVFGVGLSAFGILLAIWFLFLFNGMIDSVHQAGIEQADAVISVLQNTRIVVNSTAESVDSFAEFAGDAYITMQSSADVMADMSGAVSGLAGAVGAIPYMPAEVSGSLYSTASDMDTAAVSMQETAGSMEGVANETLSASLGINAIEEDVGKGIANLEKTKKELDAMHLTAKTGLFLGTGLLVMLFALNGLSFYRQLRG